MLKVLCFGLAQRIIVAGTLHTGRNAGEWSHNGNQQTQCLGSHPTAREGYIDIFAADQTAKEASATYSLAPSQCVGM